MSSVVSRIPRENFSSKSAPRVKKVWEPLRYCNIVYDVTQCLFGRYTSIFAQIGPPPCLYYCHVTTHLENTLLNIGPDIKHPIYVTINRTMDFTT